MTNIVYCRKWLSSQKKPLDLIDSDSARKQHESRLPYVALIEGAEAPRYIVDIAGPWVSVDFLDSRRHKYLSYNFKEVQPDRLFLKSAYYWDYDQEGDSPISTRLFAFDEIGRVVIEERKDGGVLQRDVEACVAGNWEAYPSFGEYASLCSEQRQTGMIRSHG